VIDQLAGRTEYEYDSLNRLVKIIQADPDGGGALESPETVYAYDDASQLVSVTDPLGRVTTYEYDGLGRKTLVTLPDPDGVGGDDPPETAYSFDAAGNLLTGTDALGNVTEYQYDNLFRQILVIAPDPDGGGGLASPETEFSYDLLGRLTSATDALDRVTSYEYDVLGRRIKVVQPDPDGVGGEDPPETDYEYDLAGNLVSVTDPLGNVTTYAYDNLYRRVSTTQPDPDAGGALSAPVTSFTYDAAGNITSLTDPVGNVTSWVYDAHNRAIEETNELLDTRYFEYDVAGNLIEKTDRNGLVTEFAYDDLYRLTTETWKDGETTVNTLDFTYDAASQMLTAADDVSSYEYTYNGLGQVTLIEIDNGGPLVELVQEFTPVGSRSLLAASFDDGGGMDDDFQNIFYYDNIQRLVQIDQSGVQGGNTVAEKRVNFAYNAAGQLTSIARYKDLDGGSGNLVATTSFVYDGIARLTDLTHTHDTTTIADYDWDYDAFSRVTSMSFTALVGDDGSSAYTYDDTNQLTDADHDFQTDEAYEYDENGNRTMSGYVVGDNNLTTSDGTYDYEYDDEGNRTKKTHSSSGDYVTYEWDHRNRLVGVEFRTSAHALTKRVEYEYDLFNRRILKRVDDDGDTNFDWAQRFVYDGDSIVLVFDDASSLTNRYLHGPAVDQILADEDSLGEVLWPLADNLGTIRDLVDSDGDVVNHLTYNAFGAITSQTAPSLEPLYTYTGREWDPDVELYFYRARWYDPALGQFISEDPIGFVANDPNIRRYTSNNPVRYTDPTGMLKYDKSLKPFFDAYGYPHNWTGWIEQTTNNVQPATPASTARVFVLKKDVDQALQHKGITVYHLSIMLVSDVDLTSLTGIGFKQYNGKDLPFLKNGQYYMTIGAYPTGMGYGTSDEQLLLDIVRGKAKLECSFNHPYDVPSRDLITVAEIAARKDSGLSSDALFRLLIIRAVLYRQKYQSTYTYTMIPGIGSEGHNSNSFVTSLLLHSGIYPPEFMDSPPVEGGGGVREVPGFMDIIPIGPPGPNWDDEIIIIQGRLRQ
jgi:RHS repeat-associated protein